MERLFYGEDNILYTAQDIKDALLETGAADCETLFIHSDVMFGRPAEAFNKKAYLATLYDIINGLGVKNLIVPTFTYSFCNREDYDVAKSRTSMGAFNEYIRKQSGRYRTDDPLLSVSVPETLIDRFNHLGKHSLGEGSALDILHHMEDVKFLFFGAEMAECFTYVHYVEKMMNVPYRFDMPFKGKIIYPDGTSIMRQQWIHTQCTGAKLPVKYDYFEREMEEKGYLKKKKIGNKYIACLSERDAYREIKGHILENIHYYLAEPFNVADLKHIYTYNSEDGQITHC